MKQTFLTVTALLFTCAGLLAAVPAQTLQKELNHVSGEISSARTGMNIRAAAFFIDKEEYQVLNAAYSAATIFIRNDLNVFDAPIAELQKDINLIQYFDYVASAEDAYSENPELQAAAVALLTNPSESEDYKAAKKYFKNAIQAEKDAYHTMISEEYGSFWGSFVRLYDTMNEGLEFPLEKEYNKLKKERSKNIAKYVTFSETHGQDAIHHLDPLSESIHTSIEELAAKLEPVIDNYNTLTSAYNTARLLGLVMDLSIDSTYGSSADVYSDPFAYNG